MNNIFFKQKYWIAGGIFLIAAIIILYPYSTFKGVKMEVSRTDAVKIARSFLTKQNISLNDYYTDIFIDRDPDLNKYMLLTLGDKGVKDVISKENWPTYGWKVVFYKNLAKNVPQIIYRVNLSHSGKVVGYIRSIPDSMFLPSLVRDSATKFITSYILKTASIDTSGFKLVETKEDNYSNRNDFSFRWEKELKEIKGKLILKAKVQGNQPGALQYEFEIPESYRNFFNTEDAMLGTASVLFVFFLTIFALVIFLKKYHQGEIWIKIGLRIFVIFLAFAIISTVNNWPAYGDNVGIGELGFLTVKILAFLLGMMIEAFFAILVFVTWTVSESYARELWPTRFKSVDAFINGRFLSMPAATSIFRGMIIGTAMSLLYLIVTIVLNSSKTGLLIDSPSMIGIYEGFVPAIEALTQSFISAALGSIVLTFFTINITYNKWKKKWLSIVLSGIVTLSAAVLVDKIPSVGPMGLDLLLYFAYGCFFAYIYFAFDLLTLSCALFYSSLVIDMYILAASDSGFFKLSYIVLALAYLITPVLYIISMIRKEDFVLESYGLPPHIQRISERERLKKEMEIASKMQLSLLPKEQPFISGYDIASVSIPAKEAGGDYYDFIDLANSKLGIAIGDVSGKGVGAAMYMTLTKGIFQAHAEENVSPKQVLAKVNQLLYKTIEKNSFVSMIYSILDVNNNKMIYSRAGQNPGIFCSDNDGGTTKFMTSSGIALGLDSGNVFNKVLIEEEVDICPGDLIVFYTDGFTEAMNERREEYGEEKLRKLIQENRHKPSKEIIQKILKDIKDFVDVYPQHDDMTMVIVKRV